jgi:hypothetical protein
MSVPLYVHVPVVLAMLGAHAWTFRTLQQRVRDLQAALLAKKVLLGDPPLAITITIPPQQQQMNRGDTWRLNDQNGNRVLELQVSSTTTVYIR